MRGVSELRIIREAMGVSAQEVALDARIPTSRLSRIERGLCPPTEDEASRILAALGPQARIARPAAAKFVEAMNQLRDVDEEELERMALSGMEPAE